MRRLILASALMFLARIGLGACNNNRTGSLTTNLGLYLPSINECSWGTSLNSDFRIIDTSIPVLSGTNTFTGANTFQSGGIAIQYPSLLTFQNSSGGTGATIFNPLGLGLRGIEIDAPHGIGINGRPAYSGIIGVEIYRANSGLPGGSIAVMALANGTTVYSGFIATPTITSSVLWSLPTADGTNGQILGTDGATHLGWYNQTAGSGGGTGNPLTINQNGVQITSPTLGINALSPPFIITSIGGGTTAQWTLDSSSVTLAGPILSKNNSWAGYNAYVSSTNFGGNVNLSSGILILNSPGTNGQVFTSGGSGSVPSWQSLPSLTGPTLAGTQTWSGQNNWTTPAPSSFTYGVVVGSLSIYANGDGYEEFLIGNSTYDATSSSGSYSIGQFAVFSSTNGTLIGSSSGGGGGTPGGSNKQIQYNSASSFAGFPSVVTNSSVTISTPVVLGSTVVFLPNGGASSQNTGNNWIDFWVKNAVDGDNLVDIGSSSQGDQFVVPSRSHALIRYGALTGSVQVGYATNPNRISANGDILNNIDLRPSGNLMSFNTGTASRGDMTFSPGNTPEVIISTFMGMVVNSSMTVYGAGGIGLNTPLTFGLGSVAGHNIFQTIYNDVGINAAINGWDNATQIGYFWQDNNGKNLLTLQQNGLLSETYGINAGSITISSNSIISGATFYQQTGGLLYISSIVWANGTIQVASPTASSGSPGGSSFQLQYNNAGSFGGVANTNVWASSITVSTIGVLVNGNQTGNTGFGGTGGPGILDVFYGSPSSTNRTLFAVGSGALANQFYVPNNNFPTAVLGFLANNIRISDSSLGGQKLASNGDTNSYVDLRNGSTMTLNTGTTNGPGDIRLQPAGALGMTVSNISGVNEIANAVRSTYTLTLGTSTTNPNVMFSTSAFSISAGSAPTISSCGSSPNGSVVGDDWAGIITVGGTAPTACTLTFQTNHTNCTMICNVNDNSLTISADVSSLTTSALTLGFGAGGLAGGTVYYQCHGYGTSCR